MNAKLKLIYLIFLFFSIQGFLNAQIIVPPNSSNTSSGCVGFDFGCSGDCPALRIENLVDTEPKVLPKNRTTVGIGEETKIYVDGFDDECSGSFITWEISNSDLGFLSTNVGSENTFTARIKGGTITITATLVSGYSCDDYSECETTLSITFEIIEPTVYIESILPIGISCPYGQVRHENGIVSAGFWGDIYLLPDNVSFYNLTFSEQGTIANASGYFEPMDGEIHSPGETGGGFDIIQPDKGTWMNLIDNIYTTASSIDINNPLSEGEFTWVIPVKLTHKITGEESTIFDVTHNSTCNSLGTCRTTKIVQVAANLDDPTNCPN